MIDRCLLRTICRAERPGDLQPTGPVLLAGNRAGGLAGKCTEGFAGHIGLAIGQGSNSPLMTSTYGQPPGWPEASCWPMGPSGLPANVPDRFAGQSDRATCGQTVQGDWRQTVRPRSEKLAANYFGSDSQRFLKIANDRLRETTIPRSGQRSINGRRRWTTIGGARSTLANAGQRSALQNQRNFNAGQRSALENQRKFNARQRQNVLLAPGWRKELRERLAAVQGSYYLALI